MHAAVNMPDETIYQVILSNGVDADGWYRAEVLVNARPEKLFLREDRAEAFEKAREWVEWHRSRDESVEMIDL